MTSCGSLAWGDDSRLSAFTMRTFSQAQAQPLQRLRIPMTNSLDDEFALVLDTIPKIKADLACNLLKGEGIPSMQHSPDFDVAELGVAAHAAVRGVSVYVPKAAKERALEILREAWGEEPVL